MFAATFKHLVQLVCGKYEAWRIYSILTSQCPEPTAAIRITRLDDTVVKTSRCFPDELVKANMYRPGATGLVAWSGDEPAGVCWLWPGAALANRSVGIQPDDCAELVQITVATACRGRGIAQALIMHAVYKMREQGFHRLYAQIWPTNVASVHAFEKSGWDEIAWVFQCSPYFWPRPLRLRAIRRPFRSNPGILPNWRDHPPEPVQQ
jgi:GNAT superfamily N-acetyltransferase